MRKIISSPSSKSYLVGYKRENMNISILGCGWLGLPLAKRLISEGHIVKGSTTSREKLQSLSSAGISPFVIQLFEEGIQGDITSFLKDVEVLIIDIPPGLRKDPKANFAGKIGRLESYIKKSGIKKVLFISSTSVFEDAEAMPVYTELDAANGTAENAKQIIAAEDLLIASEAFETSILRFGGLMGNGRNPVKYLSGKSGLKDPEGPVNLIHQEDCIGIIDAILQKQAWGETFHGVYPDHPTRREYYPKKAVEKGLASMEFVEGKASKGKFIKSVKIEEVLEYQFKNMV